MALECTIVCNSISQTMGLMQFYVEDAQAQKTFELKSVHLQNKTKKYFPS